MSEMQTSETPDERRHLPPEMTQREQIAVVEALEAPRGMRDERALRKIFRPDEHDGEQTSRQISRSSSGWECGSNSSAQNEPRIDPWTLRRVRREPTRQ